MKKRLLVVSVGTFHPSISARRELNKILKGQGGIDLTTTSDIEALTRLSDGGFSGVILYFHRKKISEKALDALDGFARGGGGILALHSASASFKESSRYYDILGGRFTTHGKIEPYTVSRVKNANPIFSVTEPFTITDELYIHSYDDGVKIQYATEAGGKKEPVVWTKSHGRGRVCYVSLGHVSKVLKDESVRRIITDGLSFILGVDK
jgi:type 1 glutamine amidotransferase